MIKKRNREFSDEDLLKYMALPAKEKLEYLEKMNCYINKITPKKSKRIWQKLKAEGF